jgi:putative copper export protein
MEPVDWNTARLFVHIIAATIWVGGQLTLAGLVPGARQIDPTLPKTLARRFNRLAWPAFAVLVATGLWNIAATRGFHTADTAWRTTLVVKVVVVGVSGVSAFAHQRSKSTLGLAVWGTLTSLSAIGALWLGVMLNT